MAVFIPFGNLQLKFNEINPFVSGFTAVKYCVIVVPKSSSPIPYNVPFHKISNSFLKLVLLFILIVLQNCLHFLIPFLSHLRLNMHRTELVFADKIGFSTLCLPLNDPTSTLVQQIYLLFKGLLICLFNDLLHFNIFIGKFSSEIDLLSIWTY